jgi:dTDP-4-amino-4,6-dideoxygalactose transaminase
VTESVSAKCFSLPVYPELEDEKVDAIIDVINGAM